MLKSKFAKRTSTQLDAPGNGDAPLEIGKLQPAGVNLEVTVASIDTSVVIKVEYSDDGFSTTPVDGISYTLTANGIYQIPVSPVGGREMRPVFVSEAGGTGATVDFTLTASY